MAESEHDDVIRRSFEQQVGLFSGDDSVFARRVESPLAWLEPLDPELVVLDVACGAAHVAEQVAPSVRQVVGVDLTPALLALGADRLRAAGIGNVLLQEGNAAALPFVDGSFDLVFCRARAAPLRSSRVAGRRDGPRVPARWTSRDLGCGRDQRGHSRRVRHAPPPARPVPRRGAARRRDRRARAWTTVGPVVRAETSAAATLPLEHIFHDASDREAVRAAARRRARRRSRDRLPPDARWRSDPRVVHEHGGTRDPRCEPVTRLRSASSSSLRSARQSTLRECAPGVGCMARWARGRRPGDGGAHRAPRPRRAAVSDPFFGGPGGPRGSGADDGLGRRRE